MPIWSEGATGSGGHPARTAAPPSSGNTLQSDYESLARQGGANAAVGLADLVLDHAVRQRASDIHFEPDGKTLRVRFRIDGQLKEMLTTPISPDFPVTQRLRVLAGFDPEPPKQFRPEEGRIEKIVHGRPIQVRISSFPTLGGEKIVLRIMDQGQMRVELDQIGFAPSELQAIKRILASPHGIFFVTGATGSGKTTSLYAMLKYLNKPERNLMTLEDPVEYQLEGVNQAQINPKTGFTFAAGLRSILRQDPNIVLVGEIRDFETAEISMRASLTGHLVFATLHTVSAVGSVERLMEMGVPPYLLSSSMIGSMAQRLVRKICQKCAQPAKAPDAAALERLTQSLEPAEAKRIKEICGNPGGKFHTAKGCANCSGGYYGRVPIFEIVRLDARLRKAILDKEPSDVLQRIAVENGMRTLLVDGIYKAWAGWTTMDEVLRVVGTL